MREKMTVEERLQRLETENRFFRWGAVAALVIISGTLLLGGALAQTSKQKVIEAQEFRLVDETGGSRALMGLSKGDPMLWMYDEKGKVRALMGLSKDDPMLGLYDEKGNTRAGLLLLEGNPRLTMYDEKKKVIWHAP